MEPIKPIGIPNVTIPQVVQRDWIYGIPFVPNNHPPVTLQLGFPIVEMPGCVTMHKDNKDHVTKMPFDHDLVNQDPKGSTVLCPHGEYPTYDAMDYQPESLIVTRETHHLLLHLHQKLRRHQFLIQVTSPKIKKLIALHLINQE